MRLSSVMLACGLLIPPITAQPPSVIEISPRDTPVAIPPSKDPFYTAPSGFQPAAPGKILRVRQAPGNVSKIFNESSAVYHILYRTTDSHYQPSWAVTTLFVPLGLSNHSTNKALLSYQIPYNTADVDHSPSFALGDPYDLANGLVVSDINTALRYGWHVNVPDFEGPLASFALGVSEGHATLDSVRAALSSGLGISSEARYAMWGYSGGSIASEFAAELQVQYAPELNFSGVALGGVVSNGASILSAIDGKPAAGLIPAFLVGMTKQYPAAHQYLISQLKTSGTYNATGFLAVQNMSFLEAATAFMNQSILKDYFLDASSYAHQPIIQKISYNDQTMGYHGVPQMPTFIYKAIHDEYTHVDDTDSMVARYCDVGANIMYERNTAGHHLDEETNGDARALDFLRAALNGSLAIPPGCTIKNVTIDIVSNPPFWLPLPP